MKKGERRKQELLRTAYEMFITKGYENTSVDDIINAAGIAKGTYYYYFETKEAMLEEVIGMMIEAEADAAAKVLEAPIPIPQKVVGIIASFRLEESEQPIVDTMMRTATNVSAMVSPFCRFSFFMLISLLTASAR